MRWMKRIFISLGLTAVVCLGGYLVYDAAYAMGNVAGYESGYSAGEKIGYNSGKQDGYNSGRQEGYSSGWQEGYDTGYSSGRKEGYDTGYSLGEVAGYILGEQDGYIAGETAGYEEGYAEGVEAGLGHGYNLQDPTYQAAVKFLIRDQTDKNQHVDNTYVCSHFARDVCNNAESEGLRCAFVELRYPDGGHAIIAFETIDKGMVYFEPQSDETARPVIGKQYYQCVVPKPGRYYEEPPYDDTIIDILVIW